MAPACKWPNHQLSQQLHSRVIQRTVMIELKGWILKHKYKEYMKFKRRKRRKYWVIISYPFQIWYKRKRRTLLSTARTRYRTWRPRWWIFRLTSWMRLKWTMRLHRNMELWDMRSIMELLSFRYCCRRISRYSDAWSTSSSSEISSRKNGLASFLFLSCNSKSWVRQLHLMTWRPFCSISSSKTYQSTSSLLKARNSKWFSTRSCRSWAFQNLTTTSKQCWPLSSLLISWGRCWVDTRRFIRSTSLRFRLHIFKRVGTSSLDSSGSWTRSSKCCWSLSLGLKNRLQMRKHRSRKTKSSRNRSRGRCRCEYNQRAQMQALVNRVPPIRCPKTARLQHPEAAASPTPSQLPGLPPPISSTGM